MRGRGLKHLRNVAAVQQEQSPSMRGRGLKLIDMRLDVLDCESPSMRGRGLKHGEGGWPPLIRPSRPRSGYGLKAIL